MPGGAEVHVLIDEGDDGVSGKDIGPVAIASRRLLARQAQGQLAGRLSLAARLVDVGGGDPIRHDADLGQRLETPRARAGENERRAARHGDYLKR